MTFLIYIRNKTYSFIFLQIRNKLLIQGFNSIVCVRGGAGRDLREILGKGEVFGCKD